MILVSLHPLILQHPLIYVTQEGGISHENLMALWNGDEIPNRREDLRARIKGLSRKWLKNESKHQETSSSHSVEVIELDCDIFFP